MNQVRLPDGWCFTTGLSSDQAKSVVELTMDRSLDAIVIHNGVVVDVAVNAERSVINLLLDTSKKKHPEVW